jgi:hypothetical protein
VLREKCRSKSSSNQARTPKTHACHGSSCGGDTRRDGRRRGKQRPRQRARRGGRGPGEPPAAAGGGGSRDASAGAGGGVGVHGRVLRPVRMPARGRARGAAPGRGAPGASWLRVPPRRPRPRSPTRKLATRSTEGEAPPRAPPRHSRERLAAAAARVSRARPPSCSGGAARCHGRRRARGLIGPARHGQATVVPCLGRRLSPWTGTARHG